MHTVMEQFLFAYHALVVRLITLQHQAHIPDWVVTSIRKWLVGRVIAWLQNKFKKKNHRDKLSD